MTCFSFASCPGIECWRIEPRNESHDFQLERKTVLSFVIVVVVKGLYYRAGEGLGRRPVRPFDSFVDQPASRTSLCSSFVLILESST